MEGLCKEGVYVETPPQFEYVSEQDSESSFEDSLVLSLLLELLEE